MKSSHKSSQEMYKKINPITDISDIQDKIRKSVVAVLSNSEEYRGLISKPKVLAAISEAVFNNIYKKSGKVYYAKYSGSFDNMVDNIIFTAKKVQQVEDAKVQISQAASLIASGDAETIQLDVLVASVSEKLDTESSKDLDFFESKFKNEVDKVVYAGSGMSLKSLPARKDLLYLDLILVAEGVNNNLDNIPSDELEARYLTLIGMPLVEEHIPEAIRGVFYDSKLVRIKPGKAPGSVKLVDKGGRLAVRAKAYVYKNRFPREAYVLKDREEKGLLRYSVELAFSKSECSFCNAEFKPGDQYCEHLLLRHQMKDMNFSRIVRDIYFIGGAYTTNPAEKSAISLEVSDGGEPVSNKNLKSCVNIIDDNGKVANQANASLEAINKDNADGDTKSSQTDGGHRMQFKYDSVEELLASAEVTALIEAKVTDIVDQERDLFETSLQEVQDQNEQHLKRIAELEASLSEQNTALEASNAIVANMQRDKKISDAIVDLQKSGYKFDSDAEIKAFSERVSSMSDEQVSYVMDLMKKTVLVAEEVTPAVEEQEEVIPAEEEQEAPIEEGEILEASRKAGVNPAGDQNSILTIRKSWEARLRGLRNVD